MTDEFALERGDIRVTKSPWGTADEIGRLNWMTAELSAGVLGRLDGSAVFDLSVSYFAGMPSWTAAGDQSYESWMTHTPRGSRNERINGLADHILEKFSYSGDAISMYTHCGTHIDSLNHRGYYGTCWNGWNDADDLGSRGWLRLGPEKYPPLIARGVLLDVAALHDVEQLPNSYSITPRDLRGAAESEGIRLAEKDIVLVRTGRMMAWPNAEAYMEASPGVGLDAARYLCEDIGVTAVATDTIAFEPTPAADREAWMPVHSYMLATAGAPIMEVMDMERLTLEQVFEFAFVGLPLKLTGTTGAPLRALAIPFQGS
jgi:kynurenine formamidase